MLLLWNKWKNVGKDLSEYKLPSLMWDQIQNIYSKPVYLAMLSAMEESALLHLYQFVFT